METPFENAHTLHLINKWMGRRDTLRLDDGS